MSKTNIIIGIVVLLAIGGFIYMTTTNKAVAPENLQNDNSSDTISGQTVKSDDDSAEVEDESDDDDNPAPVTNPTPAPSAGGGVNTSTYTLAQVSVHNSSTDCWSAINGGVYNLTTWIGGHPGGAQAIQSICGKDGSNAFNGQHGGDGKPENVLTKFKIGDLK
jgi:cytochrome b involved in lipid metabolism